MLHGLKECSLSSSNSGAVILPLCTFVPCHQQRAASHTVQRSGAECSPHVDGEPMLTEGRRWHQGSGYLVLSGVAIHDGLGPTEQGPAASTQG